MGAKGILPLYFVCVVSCIILWPTAGLTLYFLIPAEWNMLHTQKNKHAQEDTKSVLLES
jgi:hypothetical protein